MAKIPSKRLVYEFKRRLHHRNSSYSKAIRLEDICSYLTEGLMVVYESLAKHVEVGSEIENYLRPYEMKHVELDIARKTKDYVVAKYKEDHFKILNCEVCAKRDGCNSSNLTVRILDSDDIKTSLTNEMMKPSFEWGETLGEEGSEDLYIYTNQEFDITSVIIDYLRKPVEIHAPSLAEDGQYEDWNGEIQTEDTSLDLENFIFKKVADLAVLSALRDLGDMKDFQSQANKILNFEKI